MVTKIYLLKGWGGGQIDITKYTFLYRNLKYLY